MHKFTSVQVKRVLHLYDNQGQYAKAEPLYQWAVAIYKEALGAEHPTVAICLKNYALLLRAAGRRLKF